MASVQTEAEWKEILGKKGEGESEMVVVVPCDELTLYGYVIIRVMPQYNACDEQRYHPRHLNHVRQKVRGEPDEHYHQHLINWVAHHKPGFSCDPAPKQTYENNVSATKMP